jgi:hypothetical protein
MIPPVKYCTGKYSLITTKRINGKNEDGADRRQV